MSPKVPSHTVLIERYHKLRLALFSPEYLIQHPAWDDNDFTEMINEIVRLETEALNWKDN